MWPGAQPQPRELKAGCTCSTACWHKLLQGTSSSAACSAACHVVHCSSDAVMPSPRLRDRGKSGMCL